MKVRFKIIAESVLRALRSNAPTIIFSVGLLVVCASIAAAWSAAAAGMVFGSTLMLIGLMPTFALLGGAARRKE